MKNIQKSSKLKKFLSIVIPVCNSERSILRIYERIIALFDKTNYEIEIIMVEDHSKDKSWQVIEKLSKKD